MTSCINISVWSICRRCRNFRNLNFSQVILLFTAFFAAKSCLRKESLCPLRGDEVDAIMLPPLLVTTGTTASGCGVDGDGGRVKRKALSMRIIWLKLGLEFGSSTQHDCTMNTSSGGTSSGNGGRTCCQKHNSDCSKKINKVSKKNKV